MSGFKALRDISNCFGHELQQASEDIFSAKKPNFVDDIEKKLKDLALVSSKQKLLDAKPLSLTPHVLERVNESTLAEYGDTAMWKVLEKVTAKSLTQSHAVTALINAPNSSLDTELIETKKVILDTLNQFGQAECELRHLNSLSLEAESQAAATREELDRALAELRDCKDQRKGGEENRGPMYDNGTADQHDRGEVMRTNGLTRPGRVRTAAFELSLEAESQVSATREELDRALAELISKLDRALAKLEIARTRGRGEDTGPVYDKLSTLVDKLELMRWLIGRLVCAPSAQAPYDWLADPHRRLEALSLTREHYTVEGFTTD